MRPVRVLTLVLLLAAATVSVAFRPAATGLHVLPLASGTVDPAADLAAADPAGHDLVLVQFDDRGATALVDAIAASGAELVQPLAPVSYLVWADAAETRTIRSMDGVRFAGVLPSELRISADVDVTTDRVRVTVIGDEPFGAAAESVGARSFAQLDGQVLVVAGGLDLARDLARSPRVYSIAAHEHTGQLRDELGAAISVSQAGEAPQTGYRDELDEFGADGTGVIVSHVDGGVDQYHPDLLDRVSDCVDYTPLGPIGCTARNHDDAIGHGTHTLGIVLGTGTLPTGDLDGFTYGLGVAPGAQAVVQNAINLIASGPATYADIYEDAVQRGAVVSQNAWGPSGDPQGYDADTREFDVIVRDADRDAAGDQPIGLVFSIMNGSGGTSTQGSPDEAKNIIGVGGTGNRGRNAPGYDDLCTCSAHGPALDGRILPDLLAPGQQVVSTRAAQGTLCGLIGVGYSPTTPVLDVPSPFHAGCTGTSMASPHVTGAYAVFVEHYRQQQDDATPSPALVKAALINGAVDLSTAQGLDADGRPLRPIPNSQQGWGRMNLRNTMDAWQSGVVHVDQSVVLDASGDEWTTQLEAIDPTEPVRATLVWTDAPGHGQGGELRALVNDLDLTVTAPDGTTFLGNAFAGGWSTAGGNRDTLNNVENVYLRSAGPGSYTVSVRGTEILGDGLPSVGDLTDQDFALVVSNARVVTPAG